MDTPKLITRDAFLYLEPANKEEERDFAQCGPCRMFVPEKYLEGMAKDRCIIHGSKQTLDDDDSCGFWVAWPTEDGQPEENVVQAHADELLKIIPGSVTAEESGLVSRRVQCHRCRFAEQDATFCGLYAKLNRQFPEIFDLDEKITPHSCCNAQMPKTDMSDSAIRMLRIVGKRAGKRSGG
jgi:hypothetical protein